MSGSKDQKIPSAEGYLRELWIRVLGVGSVDDGDDFFALGGSSMQVVDMLAAVTEHYDKPIEFVEFFKNPTIANLGGLLT